MNDKEIALIDITDITFRYHMKAFHNQSTQYYIRSSQLFHSSLLRVPALLLVSNTDPVGTLTSNLTVRDSWESLGIKVRFTFQ